MRAVRRDRGLERAEARRPTGAHRLGDGVRAWHHLVERVLVLALDSEERIDCLEAHHERLLGAHEHRVRAWLDRRAHHERHQRKRGYYH